MMGKVTVILNKQLFCYRREGLYITSLFFHSM